MPPQTDLRPSSKMISHVLLDYYYFLFLFLHLLHIHKDVVNLWVSQDPKNAGKEQELLKKQCEVKAQRFIKDEHHCSHTVFKPLQSL